jgi:adenine/guanine phosphoribosyltransferase-like PRPP-binding protein
LQGKHLPARPRDVLLHFELLTDKVKKLCTDGEKVLVIGFAETATAIGAAVAHRIENSVYVHTTREDVQNAVLVSDFSEEHSHATMQRLFLSPEFSDISQFDKIVFVEDEITTGKTILNFLKTVEFPGKIVVAALVFNGFVSDVFGESDAEFVCVQKTGYVHNLTCKALPETRTGVRAEDYKNACELTLNICKSISDEDLRGCEVLVLGTEEFMFFAILIGAVLEISAETVYTHSTTRSPLCTEPPVFSRTELQSVYAPNRKTYLYNLRNYDTIVVVTDYGKNKTELVQVLREYCGNLYYIEVNDDEQ